MSTPKKVAYIGHSSRAARALAFLGIFGAMHADLAAVRLVDLAPLVPEKAIPPKSLKASTKPWYRNQRRRIYRTTRPGRSRR